MLKKYEVSSAINRGMYAGMYEPVDIIEAESASAALSIYLEDIADNLVDAKRIDDGRYEGEAEFQYYAHDSDEELTTLAIRVEEVESDQ